MSPKPVEPRPLDVGRALRTLREERPTTAQTQTLLNALHRSKRRRSPARPLALAMIATAVTLALFLPPRTKAGSAWAQALAATMNAPASHSVSRFENGRVSLEEWRSGVKRATVLYTDDGQVQSEMRKDGQHSLVYFNWAKVTEFQKEELAPNARSWALVSKDAIGVRRFDELPLGDAKIALDDPDVQVIGHTDASEGKPETYRLRQTIRIGGKPVGKPREYIVEIDPATHRIRALMDPPRRFNGRTVIHRTEIDYPAAIPASIFAPRTQVAKVDATYDYSKGEVNAQRTLRGGLGQDKGVTLRAAFLDGEGQLWAYWTGAPTTRTYAIPGVPLQGGANRNVYPSGLTGIGRVALAKIGPTVDFDVPGPKGTARFRSVPVQRIGFINHVQGVLMAFRSAKP